MGWIPVAKRSLNVSSDSDVDLKVDREILTTKRTYLEYLFGQDALARMCRGHQESLSPLEHV